VIAPAYIYRATLTRVIDGDTFEFAIDLGFKVSAVQRIRLRDLFAAEAGTPAGAAATARAHTVLTQAAQIVLVTQKTRRGADVKTLDRYVADVWVDGQLLADVLRDGPPAGIGANGAHP
jgi:endonuclease YncB( thermonuclease family)